MPELAMAMPQNETPIDFIPGGGVSGNDLIIGGANDYRGMLEPFVATTDPSIPPPNAWGFSVTGYYLQRSGGGCGASFEGGLPHLDYAPTGSRLYGFGDPVIAIDSTRNQVYMGDLRFDFSVSSIGLFRTTTANLNDPRTCPDGTHLTDASGNDTAAARCWPTGILIAPDQNFTDFDDKPHVRVDERTSGAGAGDVYVSYTFFGTAGSVINIVACRSNFTSLSDCSSPVTVSGINDTSTQFSHLSVRPDGLITVSYANFQYTYKPHQNPFLTETADIKLVTCIPGGAPNPPRCSPPSVVTRDPQPIPEFGIAEQLFRISTYPTHDYRFNKATGDYETFVVWTRCANPPIFPLGNGSSIDWIQCPAADVVMSYASGSGPGMHWSPPVPVNAGVHDQFFSWVRTDHDTNTVSIAYYSSENDAFGRSLQVMVNEIKPGSYSPTPAITVAKAPSNPSSDPLLGDYSPFFGDYIGITGRAGRAYVHFTGTNFPLQYGGVTTYGQNNQLTRISE